MDTLFSYHPKQLIELPLYLERVACGFPSPSEDGHYDIELVYALDIQGDC